MYNLPAPCFAIRQFERIRDPLIKLNYIHFLLSPISIEYIFHHRRRGSSWFSLRYPDRTFIIFIQTRRAGSFCPQRRSPRGDIRELNIIRVLNIILTFSMISLKDCLFIFFTNYLLAAATLVLFLFLNVHEVYQRIWGMLRGSILFLHEFFINKVAVHDRITCNRVD